MSSHDERCEELLAEAVTEGLTPEREAELAKLLRRTPTSSRDAIERAAAASASAFAAQHVEERLPPSLEARLAREADAFVAQQRRARERRPGGATTGAASSAVVDLVEARREPAPGKRSWGWLAVAASFLFVAQTARLYFAQHGEPAHVASPPVVLSCAASSDPAPSAVVRFDPSSGTAVVEVGPAPAGANGWRYQCSPPSK